MTINIKTFRINISIFLLVMLPFICWAGYAFEYLAAYISVTLHEIGHAAAAVRLGLGIREVRLLPTGLFLTADKIPDEKRASVILYSAGPLVNLLLLALFFTACRIWPDLRIFKLFMLSNLCLFIFNLVPVIPLDGGRILQELISGHIGVIAAGRHLRRLTLALSALMLLVGAYLLILDRVNFTLFTAGFYILSVVIASRMEAAFMNIRQIVYRHSRLLKKGVYPARDLVVLKSVKISEILKDLDYDRFHFIYVLDEKMRVAGFLSENDIMESLFKYNSSATFGQLLDDMAGK